MQTNTCSANPQQYESEQVMKFEG